MTRTRRRSAIALLVVALSFEVTGCSVLGVPDADTFKAVDEIAAELDVDSLGKPFHESHSGASFTTTPTLQLIILGEGLAGEIDERLEEAGFETDADGFWTRDDDLYGREQAHVIEFTEGQYISAIGDIPDGKDENITAPGSGVNVEILAHSS